MSHDLNINPDLNRAEKYPLILQQAEALVKDESNLIANMANIAALIKESLQFHWVGFYIVEGNELVLGPFQGPIACTRIKIPKGVCGTCVERKEAVLVPDVNKFEGHIACSSLSRSELVLPKIVGGTVKFVLDIDSIHLDDFSEIDIDYFNAILRSL